MFVRHRSSPSTHHILQIICIMYICIQYCIFKIICIAYIHIQYCILQIVCA
jgi:hypothetical protein